MYILNIPEDKPISFLNTFTENVRNYPNMVALEFIDPPLQRWPWREGYARVDHIDGDIVTLNFIRRIGIIKS